MKKVISLLLVISMLAVCLVGCGGNPSETQDTEKDSATTTDETKKPDSSEKEEPKEPKYGGMLKVGLTSNVKNMDPLYIDSRAAEQVALQLGETLIITDENNSEYLPQLATSWEISEDGLTYVFQLRDDVHFHKGQYQDGRLMTAEDVAWSLNRSKDYFCNYLTMLDKFEATGEHEVTAHLLHADATFMYQLTHSSTCIVPKEEIEGWGKDFTNHYVGTGPFYLESHQPDQGSVLKRNENYWGPKPYLDGIEFRIVPDQEQCVNALKTGELDIIHSVSGQNIDIINEDPNLELLITPTFSVDFIGFNMEDEILKNDQVREALICATDYDMLAKAAYPKGEGVPAKVNVPKLSWGYKEEYESLVPAYDVERAKELLKEAGYGDGFTLKVTYKENPISTRALTVLQQMWAPLGINLEISPVESTTYMDMLISGTIQLWAAGQFSSPDPATSVGYQFATEKLHSNYNAWCVSDPEVDGWIEEALSITDREKRLELYSKCMEKVIPMNIGIFYGNRNGMWAIRNTLHGVVPSAQGIMLVANGGVNMWKE